MANTDIYPYGQNEQMPAGYPIANDLDTNDAQQSLSAAMGYQLKRMMTTIEIVPTELMKQVLRINSSNACWLIDYAQQNDLRSVSYPVAEGERIKVGMVGEGNLIFAIVTAAAPVDLGPINFADGESLRSIAASDGEVEIVAPANSAKIVFNWKSQFEENPFTLAIVSDKCVFPQMIEDVKKTAGLKNRIIVAASNTPEELASKADIKCTGTNDEVELQSAIDNAIGNSLDVLLLRGDYYLDSPIKTYASSNDTFLLIDTSPPSGSTTSRSLRIEGENPAKEISANIHLGNSAYESLNGTKQYSLLAVKDSTQYGGFVEIKNMKFYLPSNQKKVCALDMVDFGGYARLHSLYAYAYTNGYNGQNITISNPPAVAVEGCIGIKFIGKGPNGSYGSEITDCNVFGFNEGICINTEWTVCNHVCSIFCVTGWVFGKYTTSQMHSSTHPIVLINCGDERGINLPYFHTTSGMQDIEMIAFSIERNAANTPGGVLGNLAMERVPGSFRGRITYCTGQGSGNWVNVGFWTYGHGHGMKTTDASHAQAGPTSLRNTYRPNFMQRYFDTTLGKEIICIDESGNNGKGTWVDAAGNIV